jgi:hypothetical protein
MKNKIQIHKPAPTLHLPAHERKAAARRRHNAALPGIPNARTTNSTNSTPHPKRHQTIAHPLSH